MQGLSQVSSFLHQMELYSLYGFLSTAARLARCVNLEVTTMRNYYFFL